MTLRKNGTRSLGDLIASVYEHATNMTDDERLAKELAARVVARRLARCGRLDLARLLTET